MRHWAVGALYFDFPKAGPLGQLSFTELKQRSLINERARAADQDPDFSSIIREGLPGAISKSRNERRIFKLHISPVI